MSTGGSDHEIFRLPDGTEVGTGNVLAAPEDEGLLQTVGDFPEDLYLDPSDIRKLLPDGFYKSERQRQSGSIINQGRLGKCCASAAQAGVEEARNRQGFKPETLCDNHLYWRINGGRDSGAPLIRAFSETAERGICRRRLPLNGRSFTIPLDVYNRRQLATAVVRAADQDGKHFRGVDLYRVPKDWDRFRRVVASALARRQPIVMAWHVGNQSMRLRNGYCQPARGVGNHACLFHSAKFVGGSDIVHPDLRNSWGPASDPLRGRTGGSGWGEGGFGLMTMSDAYRCIKYHDFYVIAGIMSDADYVA